MATLLLDRNEEAVAEHELAKKDDPFNPMITAFTGLLYSYLGRYEDGIQEAFKSLDIQKDCPDGYFVLGETYMVMGREEDALESHQKLAEVSPLWCWVLGFTYARTKHHAEAEKMLDELENAEINSWNAMGIGLIYGALGNKDEAFKWLSYEPHHAWIPWTAIFPGWKPLYGDKRHIEFVRRLNLPE